MKQSQAFHKGIRRVWSRPTAGSGTSRLAINDTLFSKDQIPNISSGV